MKSLWKVSIIAVLSLSLFAACSSKKEETKKEAPTAAKKVEQKSANQLPAGYPAEVTLPNGITANMIGEGEGTISSPGSGQPDKKYKSYEINKSRPQNYKEIVAHYRGLLTKENGWEGSWGNDSKEEAYGVFKKGNVKVKVEADKDYFMLHIEVMQN